MNEAVRQALDDARRLRWRRQLIQEHGLSAQEADRLVALAVWYQRARAAQAANTAPSAEEDGP